ncbi:hypothetical protein C8F04DRAFT_1180614 [Mycena alexandri]|uniref:Uncharacterized protein n=1 Tax=Mycena alexandri TaxID=1745969 RepID=A0AAD6T0N2_9AGAR|nr:hypothetical protein C8F04DRAFT_1180614 [Mycena alexandri]
MSVNDKQPNTHRKKGLTEQGQAVRGELEHRGCGPQLLRSFPSLAATSIPRAPSPADRNKAAGREARRRGTKSGTFSLQGARLTGGLPLLRVKAAQPEMRLAEVAAIVALLPIWEVDGLAHLHPYLREELGGGDEALVVAPYPSLAYESGNSAMVATRKSGRSARLRAHQRRRRRRKTDEAYISAKMRIQRRRRLRLVVLGGRPKRIVTTTAPTASATDAAGVHGGGGQEEEPSGGGGEEEGGRRANPVAETLDARRPRRATDAESDDDSADEREEGVEDRVGAINERFTLGNRAGEERGGGGGKRQDGGGGGKRQDGGGGGKRQDGGGRKQEDAGAGGGRKKERSAVRGKIGVGGKVDGAAGRSIANSPRMVAVVVVVADDENGSSKTGGSHGSVRGGSRDGERGGIKRRGAQSGHGSILARGLGAAAADPRVHVLIPIPILVPFSSHRSPPAPVRPRTARARHTIPLSAVPNTNSEHTMPDRRRWVASCGHGSAAYNALDIVIVINAGLPGARAGDCVRRGRSRTTLRGEGGGFGVAVFTVGVSAFAASRVSVSAFVSISVSATSHYYSKELLLGATALWKRGESIVSSLYNK